MNWHVAMENAEKMLNSPVIPSSLELISLIKKVNPTTICLSESERELGYEMKSRLQNLLLEQYGEAFYLDPYPLKSNIVLIKHTTLPSIDACHTDLAALSCKALDTVAAGAHAPAAGEAAPPAPSRKNRAASSGEAAQELLEKAEGCLAEYDFAGAGELLGRLRISDSDDIPILERSARLLVEEAGAYKEAIALLLAQRDTFLRDPRLRVLLARAYHLDGAIPEARAIFDVMQPAEFDKEALVAYADIARNDGNLTLAWKLVRSAEEKRGFVEGLECLKTEVETALHAAAAPLVERAVSALDSGEQSQAHYFALQALEQCPNHDRAREIIDLITSGKQAAEIGDLWERLAQTEDGQARLELLQVLLRGDAGNHDRISGLISAEKTRQKNELAQARLERLRTLARQGAWREAFEIVWWLQDQEDQHEAAREACQMSPYLSLLYENRRLRKLSQKNARQLWLDTVKAMADLQSGQLAPALGILESAKHCFEKYELFKRAYDEASQAAEQKAREEIKALLHAAGREGTTLNLADHYYSGMRKVVVHLPAEERDEYCRLMEARIAELTRDRGDKALRSYKCVAMSGSHDRAAIIRSYISDEGALDACDQEIAAEMSIERSSVNLEFSDSLQVDLLSDQPLIWIGSTDRHILLRESDEAIVVLHLEKMRATRFVSANFKDLHIRDSIPSEDTFLFINVKNPLPRWRAELSDEKSAFTGRFDVTVFREHEDECPVDVWLSSEKADEYYVMIWDIKGCKPGRVERKKLWNRRPVSDSIKIGNAVQPIMKRLSWHPDKFIIGADDIIKVCVRNLTADYSVDISPRDVWAIDVSNGQLYYLDRTILKKTDFKWEHTERFLNSECCYFFNQHQKLGLCPETTTLMLSCGPRAGLYDYSCNRISSYFNWGRIIGTRPAHKWYTYDYCRETRTLTLRDVTHLLGTLLEWEEAEVPLNGRDERNPDWELKLHEQIYFGFKAEEQPEQHPDREESQ